jgi:RNA polymerase sigma-70 factor, ECF subfamily
VTADVEAAVARAFRDERGRIVATLIRLTGDWGLAEECAHETFARALHRWGRNRIPRNPGAWLTTTARNRAVELAPTAAERVHLTRRLAETAATN